MILVIVLAIVHCIHSITIFIMMMMTVICVLTLVNGWVGLVISSCDRPARGEILKH